MKPASYWIDQYQLQPHPEGGFYAETYRATETMTKETLPARFNGDRSFCTGIYFLMEELHFSAFHKIQSDEMWHFYAGDTLEIFVINPENGALNVIKLGADPDHGETFQAVVPAGAWFGSRPAREGAYSLVGCTVAPGFDFEDFEMAKRDELQSLFPQHKTLIQELTRS